MYSQIQLCPLCDSSDSEIIHEDKNRSFKRCNNCKLIFVLDEQLLNSEEEKAQYDLHINDPSDPGYRRFLSRALNPVIGRIKAPALGLDVGSGPGPTLNLMAEEAGYEMAIYDPYYAPDDSVFEKQYDFITLTEVIEHVTKPCPLIEKLLRCLKAQGILLIMTKRWYAEQQFPSWHYKNDPTHIRFYHEQTFDFIANNYNLELEVIGPDVIIFKKLDP